MCSKEIWSKYSCVEEKKKVMYYSSFDICVFQPCCWAVEYYYSTSTATDRNTQRTRIRRRKKRPNLINIWKKKWKLSQFHLMYTISLWARIGTCRLLRFHYLFHSVKWANDFVSEKLNNDWCTRRSHLHTYYINMH